MPRAAPSSVTEHRVTLGDYERRELAAFLEANQRDQDLELVLDIAKAAAMPVAIGAVGYLAYLGLTNFGLGLDILRTKWTAYVAGSKPAEAVISVTDAMAVDVSQGKEGDGGGGGSRTGVYGGSVFM